MRGNFDGLRHNLLAIHYEGVGTISVIILEFRSIGMAFLTLSFEVDTYGGLSLDD